MKKKIFALALATVSLLSFGAYAQKNDNCPANGKQNCRTAQCDNKGCRASEKCKDNKDCKQRKACCNLFEGLNLNQSQKDRLKAISTPRQTIKAGKDAGYDKNVDRREYVRTVRADYLKQIKAVLTPEQYTKFLENFYLNAGGKKHNKYGKGFNGKKHDKKGKGKFQGKAYNCHQK